MSVFNFTNQFFIPGTPSESIFAFPEDIFTAPQNNYNLEQSKLLDNIFVGVDWPNWEINALYSCIKQKIIPRNRQPRAISDSMPMKEEIYKIIFPNCKKSKSKVDFNYIPWNEKHHQKKRLYSFQVEDPHELERVFGKNWNFITHQKMFVCLHGPITFNLEEERTVDYEGDDNDPYVAKPKSRKVVSSTVCSFRMQVTGSTLFRKNETLETLNLKHDYN